MRARSDDDSKTICPLNLRLMCLLNLEDLTVYKIVYSAVDEKPEIAWKCLKIMVGAKGFEPSTSWSRTIDVKQSNLLNRRRIAVQLPPSFGLLTGLRCLTLNKKTFSSKIRTTGSLIPRIRAFCFLSLNLGLSSAWSVNSNGSFWIPVKAS